MARSTQGAPKSPQTTTVGAVDKVQSHVDATQAGQTRALAVNSDVYFRDRCHSGEGARLQATLKDGTQLTLGENATLVLAKLGRVTRDDFSIVLWLRKLERHVDPTSPRAFLSFGGGSSRTL
jgi:hypothetical protein